ncbi:hypothetical protein DFH28DRAFT_1220375 [Melampsora americana]|nr:hypothetical protein DFH28DRAFT_1044076 [Melampsora americana]KAH9816811.1 hypothetical protein DFH28DRAFT_1220375 [Melampsora americana]
MSDQLPPPPNATINSTNPPNNSRQPPTDSQNPQNHSENPPATPINSINGNNVVWGLPHPISPLQLISTYPSQSNPFIPSPSPLLIPYPAGQPLQPTTQPPSPVTMAQPDGKAKKGRGARLSKRDSKKKSPTTNPSIITSETTVEQPESTSVRKQLSWNKDMNAEGKTMLDLIVEWLGFTWGDQESAEDVIWMCMESHDTESTNFTRYRMGIPKKKECADRCGKFLSAKGFGGFTWAGIKQQIDTLETKFRAAEAWRTDTGGGVMLKSNADVEIEALHTSGEWSVEKDDEIRASAAKTTKDILASKCTYYDALLPVMGDRPSNEPLHAAESGMMTSTENNSFSGRLPAPDESESTRSIQDINWDGEVPLDGDGINSGPESDEMVRPRTSGSNYPQSTGPSQSEHNSRRSLPTPSQPSNTSTINLSRRSSSSSSFLKSIQSSLPTQSDLKEITDINKISNQNQRLMIEKVAEASEGMVSILGARYGIDKAIEKRPPDDEDQTPEAIARRKAKKIKQDELELIRLERELAQERKALEVHSRGSGMSKLELARERIDMITKLAAANIPYAEAERMADAVIDGLQNP